MDLDPAGHDHPQFLKADDEVLECVGGEAGLDHAVRVRPRQPAVTRQIRLLEQALGIDLTRLRVWVFVLGTMLAAFAGVIMAPLWGIRPHMGVDAVVPAFLIIVLGGVGSFWGAAIGGILVGMVVGLSGAYASEWSMLSMYLLLIAVVTFRARGLFGKKSVLEA